MEIQQKLKPQPSILSKLTEFHLNLEMAWTMFKSINKSAQAGNVCLDMLLVNVTDINCNKGDEDHIFKNQLPIKNLVKKISLFMNF